MPGPLSELTAAAQRHLPEALRHLEQLVGVNSFTANREGVAENARLIADLFSLLGFTAEFVPSTNARHSAHLFLTRSPSAAPRETSRQTICAVSHLDTVYPPKEEAAHEFSWQPETGTDRIFGPGTVDIKGGTMTLWLMLQALRNALPETLDRFDWLLAFNSSEEDSSVDFAAACEERFRSRSVVACLVFEGGSISNHQFDLVASRKGRATYRIEIEGHAAHAGSQHFYGASAIREAARLVTTLEAMTSASDDLTLNVGSIRGGGLVNRVPHDAQIELEIRAASPDVLDHACSTVEALAGPGNIKSVEGGYQTTVRVEKTGSCPAMPRTPGTDHLLKIYRRAATQLDPPGKILATQRGGLSDANYLCQLAPTIDGLGPDGGNAHCSQRSPDGTVEPEFMHRDSLVPKAVLSALAVREIAFTLSSP